MGEIERKSITLLVTKNQNRCFLCKLHFCLCKLDLDTFVLFEEFYSNVQAPSHAGALKVNFKLSQLREGQSMGIRRCQGGGGGCSVENIV